MAPRLLRAALPELDGWNWDGFHYDVDDFLADWDKVRAVAEEIGRNPATLSLLAHLARRAVGRRQWMSSSIWQTSLDRQIGQREAEAFLPHSPDRQIGQMRVGRAIRDDRGVALTDRSVGPPPQPTIWPGLTD